MEGELSEQSSCIIFKVMGLVDKDDSVDAKYWGSPRHSSKYCVTLRIKINIKWNE